MVFPCSSVLSWTIFLAPAPESLNIMFTFLPEQKNLANVFDSLDIAHIGYFKQRGWGNICQRLQR